MPLVMSASWRRVAVSPLGRPGTYLPMGSSRESLPSCISWRIAVTVNVLVMLPMRVWSEAVGGSVESRPAVPELPVHS